MRSVSRRGHKIAKGNKERKKKHKKKKKRKEKIGKQDK